MKYVRCLCFSVCARGSIILRCLSTLDSVLSHVAVGGRQRSDVTLVLFPPPPSVADHILHAAVCRVCDAQPGGIHPLLPERSAGQLSGRLSTGEISGTSATPHCPVVCPLIELSTQLWRQWLRKSNLIKPKNRGGQCRLRFDQGTAREKKLFVFIYSIKFGSTAVKQCESA